MRIASCALCKLYCLDCIICIVQIALYRLHYADYILRIALCLAQFSIDLGVPTNVVILQKKKN